MRTKTISDSDMSKKLESITKSMVIEHIEKSDIDSLYTTYVFRIFPYDIKWEGDRIFLELENTWAQRYLINRWVKKSTVSVDTGSGVKFLNHKLTWAPLLSPQDRGAVEYPGWGGVYYAGQDENGAYTGSMFGPNYDFHYTFPFGFYIRDYDNIITPENEFGLITIELEVDIDQSVQIKTHGLESIWGKDNVIVDDRAINHSKWMKNTFLWQYNILNSGAFTGDVVETINDSEVNDIEYNEQWGVEFGGVLPRAYAPKYCRKHDSDIILEAYLNVEDMDFVSNPDILNVICHGENTHTEINMETIANAIASTTANFRYPNLQNTFPINVIKVGAGNLETADASWPTSYGTGMEFIEPTLVADMPGLDIDPDSGTNSWSNIHQQSPAVAIVGAKMKYIKNQTGFGWNTIRLACRETATQSTANIAAGIKWDKYRGFGVINVAAAITYIENLKTSFKTGLTERYNESKGYCSFMDVEDFTDNTPLPKRLTAQAPKGNYADNAAALTAGLSVGDYYHTDGIIKIVIPAT